MNFEEMKNMNQMDLSDKTGQAHKDIFRTMLGVNEVPLRVLQRYFLLKITLDKACGHLSPCDLLRIAMDCGFNLETRLFATPKPLMQPCSTQTVDSAETTVIETEPETEAFSYETCETCGTSIVDGDCDCSPDIDDDDNDLADAVHEATAEAADDTIAEIESEVVDPNVIQIGTPVRVLIDLEGGHNEIADGKITGRYIVDKKQLYSVTRDDNGKVVENVPGNEIDVIEVE